MIPLVVIIDIILNVLGSIFIFSGLTDVLYWGYYIWKDRNAVQSLEWRHFYQVVHQKGYLKIIAGCCLIYLLD